MSNGSGPRLAPAMSANASSLAIAAIFAILISCHAFVDRGYFESMPQDLLGYLDGVYRTYLGFIPHRDFGTSIGPLNFLPPALIMKAGADPLASIRYSTALTGLLALGLVLYIQRTRLEPVFAIVFAAMIAILLMTKLTLGDENLTDATAGMAYNRNGYAFLMLAALLIVPARETWDSRIAILDGVFIGLIAGALFYLKVTFGLVALGLIGLSLFSERPFGDRLRFLAAALLAFLAVAVLVDFVYGVHFRWLEDVRMAAASKPATIAPLRILVICLPELVATIAIPLAVMAASGFGLRFYWILLALYIVAVSALLATFGAQGPILVAPMAFLVAATACVARADLPGSEAYWFKRGLFVWAILVMAGFSYPLLYNIVYSSVAAHRSDTVLRSDNPILKTIRTRKSGMELNGVSALDDIENRTPLSAFVLGRESKRVFIYDVFTFREYARTLEDGLAAARAGCPDRARIATFDNVNPFPVLLGWPAGHNMVYISVGYLVSKRSHPSAERMLGAIDCILVPDLEVDIGTADFLKEIYADYLKANFHETHRSKYWTVLARSESEATPAH